MPPDLPPKRKTVRRHVRRLALKPGQPSPRSKLTDEVQQKICNAVSSGQTFECAASLVGIDRHTLNDWRARGQQQPGSRYAEFNQALEQALLASEMAQVCSSIRTRLPLGRMDNHGRRFVVIPEDLKGSSCAFFVLCGAVVATHSDRKC